METRMIFDLPPILGIVPIIIFAIMAFKGKNIFMSVGVSIILGAILSKQTLLSFSNGIANGTQSFLALIGFIIMMGAGLGEILRQTNIAPTLVYFITNIIGLKTKNRAILGIMVTSSILSAMLGATSGANAMLAPVFIPIAVAVGLSPSTLSIAMMGAGLTGMYWGPFTPPTVTTLGFTGLSYSEYMLYAGFPISLIVFGSTYIAAQLNQSKYNDIEIYEETKDDIELFIPDKRAKKITIYFLLAMLITVILGIIIKGRASYAILVIVVSGLVASGIAGKTFEETVEMFITGAKKMVWLYVLFCLFDPFINFISETGGFHAVANLLLPLAMKAGKSGFILLSTFIGIFGVPGAAVAQQKVLHDLFINTAVILEIPMTIWALVLLVGSQMTSYVYPTGDMMVHYGLARSKNLKVLIKSGIQHSIFVMLYVIIISFLIV